MKKDAVLIVRIPAEVKAALAQSAEDDHGRSMSSMAVRILREWLEAERYLKPEKKRKGKR